MKINSFFIILIIVLFTGCYESDNIYVDETPYNSNYNNYPKKSKHHYNKTTKIGKPYYVLGKYYYPIPAYRGQVFRGVASWYGPDFHGKLTANGEIYNMYGYTAANKILPLGTIVRVTNLNNNKSVKVRINDRGPFVAGRIIDLSYVAGKKIGIDKTGTAPVKVVVLSSPISKAYHKTNTKIKKNGKISIQVGAFKDLSGAKLIKMRYKNSYIIKKNGIYKVLIGRFNSRDKAVNFKENNNINGFIVRN